MFLLRKPVMLLGIAVLLLAAVVPVAALLLAPLVFAGFVVAARAAFMRHSKAAAPFRPTLVTLLLAPHRPRAALPSARS